MTEKNTNNKFLIVISVICFLSYELLNYFVPSRRQQIFIKLLRLAALVILLVSSHLFFEYSFFPIITAVLLTHPLAFWLDFATRRQLAFWQLKKNYLVLENSNNSYEEEKNAKMELFQTFARNYHEWGYREMSSLENASFSQGYKALFGLDKRIEESVEVDILIVSICFGLGLSAIVLFYFGNLNLTIIFKSSVIFSMFILIVIVCLLHNYLLSKIVFQWIDSIENLR